MQTIPVISETPTWENIFDTSDSVDGYIYDVVDSTTIKVIATIPETDKNISILCKLEDCEHADANSDNVHEANVAKKNKKKLRQLVARKYAKLYFNGMEDNKYLVTCYVDNNNINDYCLY